MDKQTHQHCMGIMYMYRKFDLDDFKNNVA